MAKLKGMSKSALLLNAEDKIKSAETLAVFEQYDDAVYLCGYALEMTLKAVVCAKQSLLIYPDDKKKYRIHGLENLIDFAGIRSLLTAKINSDVDFQVNWSLATSWSPELRYNRPNTNTKENWDEFFIALTDTEKGVLSWLKSQL